VSVKGSLSTVLGGARPYVKAALETSDVLLDLFLPAAKPVNTARSRQRRANGLSPTSAISGGRPGDVNPRWSPEPIDLSGAKFIDADIELAMRGLSLDGIQLIQPRLVFQMKNGLLNVKSFKANVLGGAVSGAGVLDASVTPPKISAALHAREIDSGSLFQLMEAPARLSGPVTLEFSGGALGASQAEFIASLNGAGRLSGRVQVQVSKTEQSAAGVLNIASALFGKKVKELGQVGDVSSVLFNAFGQKPAELTSDIVIRNGVASTKNGRLAGVGAHALITGAVDLPQWRIDSRASMFLDGSNAVVIFADVTGSLDSPNIKPGGNVLRRSEPSQTQTNPIQQVLPGLLGGNGSNEKPKARDLIEGLLKGLGG
ncbi:MAG: AsmA family protein, partial [Alphaproteobacteria bacterium]